MYFRKFLVLSVFCIRNKKNGVFLQTLFIFSVLFLASCDKNRVFEDNKDIPDGVWSRNNKVSFQVNIIDSITPHNIFVNIRNSGSYPYRNIYLFITTTSKGITVKDTFECILADEKGKWYGNGLGDIWDNQLLFKKNIRFPHTGLYTFEYEQAMRNDDLPMIMDVGLRIEKVK